MPVGWRAPRNHENDSPPLPACRGTACRPQVNFDRDLQTVREYHERVEHIHFNLVKVGLVSRPEHRQ